MRNVKRPHDPHYKTTLSVALHGSRLQFHVAQDLFSSASLDPGTALLLRTLAGAEYSRVLDLGSGYGPLALFLKAWRPEAAVDAVDRDQLAVRYTAMNADLNHLDVTAFPSLGYDDVTPQTAYDLIVSNIPAKSGPKAIESFVLDGGGFLAPGGRMAIVVITRIADDVRKLIGEPLLEKTNRGYTCFHYAPPSAGAYTNGFDRGIYDRGRLRHKSTEITTVYGLPEFDTPGFATQLAIKLIPRLKGLVRVVNPGQGLIPALVSGRVSVDDRDLLALRNTARNARLVDGEPDAHVVMLRERDPAPDLAGRVLVAGTSTQITRVTEGRDVVERVRNKGFSAAIIET